MEHCIPDQSCGDKWHRCFENIDVADLISEENGGFIVVEVSSTGVNTGPCDKNGFPLYSRMVLRESLSHREKLSVWIIIGSILGGLLLLILVLWFLFVCFVRNPHARVYQHQDATLVEGSNVDVESCVENEDNCEDNQLYALNDTTTAFKLEVEKSMAKNLAKIVPAEEEPDIEKQEEGVGREKISLTVGRPPPKGLRPGNSHPDFKIEDLHE
jgi:hypothetical protein